MGLIADILLIAGAIGAAVYCLVVSRRVSRLASLEGGMGSAIAVLSAEVDGMTRALSAAQTTAAGSTAELADLTARAEETARRLELLLAAMHDIDTQARPARPAVVPADHHASDADADDSGSLFLTRRTRLERSA